MTDELAYLDGIDDQTDLRTARFVIRDMGFTLPDQSIQHKGIRALWAMGLNRENKDALTIFGAGSAIINAMSAHPSNARLLRTACSALKTLGGNLHALYRYGAGDEILSAMKNFPKDSKLQKEACGAIKNLGRNESNSYAFVNAGAGQLIAKAMEMHPNSDELQASGCAALATLAHSNAPSGGINSTSAPSGGSTITLQKLWDADTPVYVLKAMSLFPSLPQLQRSGISAVSSLKFPYSMMRLGAGELLVDALKNHPDDREVCIRCSRVLKAFASVENIAAELVSIGAAEVIMECLRQQLVNTNLQEDGCMALWALSLWKDNKALLVKAKTGEFALEVLKRYREDKTVLRSALAIVTNLATLQENARQLVSIEVGHTVVEVLKLHKQDESVVEKAICCLQNIYYWERQELKALSLDRLLAQILLDFPDNNKIQKKGLSLQNKLRE